MTNNSINPKNKIDSQQQYNELSDEELTSVSGGIELGKVVDAAKDFVTDVYKEGKDLVSDIGENLDKYF
ncbi:bacteriocin [Nostoc sp. DedQUE09]|uniref:bacteriocin n=1 Tax=Nostoc sp. DedQUE09 TaxID=3075394 RepID=UPI002AD42D7B|nr:bacteriocin [Nostoc sp. DedQUE09]MDZ7952364.1 bacteriocin [Nostoc sp. DedQUE09]MDZ7952367.1 bacteriocin [Nostoc sp. DedQUE09]